MPYEDEPGAYWALLGPRAEHRRTAYDASALEAIETPIRYFSDQRPSKAEVTEFFGTLAVGA